MYYGICQWNFPLKGPKGCYELLKLGLDGMELNYSHELIENLDLYLKAKDEIGIKFPTIGMNIFCNESYVCRGSNVFFEQEVKKALKCANQLGVKIIQFPAFFASDINTEFELEIAAKNLQKACQLAEEYNIFIATENALDSKQNLKLFSLVNHPLFKFYFDNQNLWRMKGKSCRPVLEVMKNNIIEVHAKDSIIQNGVQCWTSLGKGDAEFYSSMEFLKKMNYEGWVHLENDYNINYKEYDYKTAIKEDLFLLKNIFH